MSASLKAQAVAEENARKAVELWNAGLSVEAIAIRLKRSKQVVAKAIKNAGIKKDGRYFWAAPDGGSGSKTRAGNFVRRT